LVYNKPLLSTRILWKNYLKFNPGTELSKLADDNLMVYPMKACRQSNNVDCGVFVLHFIDQFVGFEGTDEEQFSRVDWQTPLNVEEKRKEISIFLKERKESTYRHDLHPLNWPKFLRCSCGGNIL